MRVRYIKSATVVIEHNGVKVLCDPWLTDGIYYGSWFHWPPLKMTAADFHDVDYIYISHVHPDHCDEATLRDMPKNIPVLICDFHEKFLLRRLKALGFETVIEVPNRGTVELGKDFKVEILAGDDNNCSKFALSYGIAKMPYYDKSRNIDSLAIFSTPERVLVNSNDVPVALICFSFPYILDKYKNIDMLLVSYAGAGPFPQAYDMHPNEKLNASVDAAYTFIGATMLYIQHLKPRFFMPYAGQYTLGGKVHMLNCFKGTMELDELILDLLPAIRVGGSMSEMVIVDTGEYFDLETAQASAPHTPIDLIARERYTKEVLSQKLFDYEADESVAADFLPQMKLARQTMWGKQREFNYFDPSDIYIDVGHGGFYKLQTDNCEVTKTDRTEKGRNQLIARLDSRLMQRILSRKANWNNAEIGSHIKLYDGIVDGSDRNFYPMPHFLMSYFQCPTETLRREGQEPLKETAGRLHGST